MNLRIPSEVLNSFRYIHWDKAGLMKFTLNAWWDQGYWARRGILVLLQDITSVE